ncbi:DNA cytosine methyltransferase [Agrobacterium salinitolerans]|nr:DNA cytosine methyltransferase [Agrobacterium salinitolerans]
MSNTIKAVDLFCGCGGLSVGLGDAGFNVVAGIDAWQEAIEVYKINNHHDALKMDISDVPLIVNTVTSYKPDLIAGGPPCQDFSNAGSRVEGSRADLTNSFAKVVEAVQPGYFIMENVERATKSKAFKSAYDRLASAGYGLSLHVLDASLCGVPQKRKRMFLVGAMGAPDNFLLPFVEAKLSKKPMTVRDYFGDECNFDHYYRHPRNYARRAVYSVDEPAATIRGVNRPIPNGYKPHSGDTADVSSVAPLSTAQRSRIQTFPPGYKWLGSKTAQEQMIGNAVPVNLGRFIGEALFAFDASTLLQGGLANAA